MDAVGVMFGLGLVVVILLAAAVAVYMITRQQKGSADREVPQARVKHHFLANPIFWLYILFPVAIVVGTWMIYAWF